MHLRTSLCRAQERGVFQDRRWPVALGVIGAIGLLALAGLLIWYASIVCVDIPFIDDWKFIALLKEFVQGQIGWTYFFEPHNGHPMMLDRIAFFLDWKLNSLNMATLRWCTVTVMLAIATLLGARLYFDLLQQQAAVRWTRGEAILLTVPTCALALSLGQWEYLMVAASIDLAAASFLFLLSIFLLDRWCSTRRAPTLAAALLSAVVASMTQMQGIMTWPAMALLLILDSRRKRHLPIFAVVILTFFVFVGITWTHLPDRSSLAFEPLTLLMGNIIVIGHSYLGHVNNKPTLHGNMVFGCVVWILTAAAAVLYLRSSANMRVAMNKYVALIAFGIATSLMIEIGRLHYSLEYLAASRYGGYVMPWAWGLCGLLTLSIKSGRIGAVSAFANIALILIGVGISNVEEGRIAMYRRQNYQDQIKALCDGKSLNDRAALRKTFYVGDQYIDLVAPMRNYLLTHKLSFFRDTLGCRGEVVGNDVARAVSFGNHPVGFR